MENPVIKVLLVEDTMVWQRLLKTIIENDSRFKLIAIAENGQQAVELVKQLRPDVVSMDVNMPVMDGVDSTRQIMQECPTPIVIASSFYNPSEVDLAMRVLEAGAVTIIEKPYGPEHPKYEQSCKFYLNTLKSMSEIKVVRRKPKPVSTIAAKPDDSFSLPIKKRASFYEILAIGASAGGPEGLRMILSKMPVNFPIPVMLVQHIDPNFIDGFCAWLNTFSTLKVRIAFEGETLKPGFVYLAPSNTHLSLRSKEVITLRKEHLISGPIPSVNYLFKSVREFYGDKCIAVLLSGMGKDGAMELKNLYDEGAFTMAQDETSSLVFGMPGEAIRLGGATKVLSPENIINHIKILLQIN